MLQTRGLVLEMLTSRVFLETGELDLTRFDTEAQAALKMAIEFARQKGHSILSRLHVLYGLMLPPCRELQVRLRARGHDVEQLADVLLVSVEAGAALAGSVEGKLSEMTTGLRKALCAAELDAKSEQKSAIGERHLLIACFRDGGGEAGKFLVANRVRPQWFAK
jgi:ATP-dependent Clp protease ATP-binding subunit ClpA